MRRTTREAASFRLAPATKNLLVLLAQADGSQAEVIDRAVREAGKAAGLVSEWSQDEVERAQSEGREWSARFMFSPGSHPGAVGVTDYFAPLREMMEATWFGAVTGWNSGVLREPYLEMRFVVPPAVSVEPGQASETLREFWADLTRGRGGAVEVSQVGDEPAA